MILRGGLTVQRRLEKLFCSSSQPNRGYVRRLKGTG
jgi:hypothetical protein